MDGNSFTNTVFKKEGAECQGSWTQELEGKLSLKLEIALPINDSLEALSHDFHQTGFWQK